VLVGGAGSGSYNLEEALNPDYSPRNLVLRKAKLKKQRKGTFMYLKHIFLISTKRIAKFHSKIITQICAINYFI
jgi:hypothetical protein